MERQDHIDKRYRAIRWVLVLTLLLNLLVALAKMLYGYLTRCSSITADGLHSLSDGTSNILCLAGIYYASQPKDADHPYGHRKYETLFSLAIAGLLAALSLRLLSQGIERFLYPVTPQIDYKSFIVMLGTLAINIWVMVYERNKGRELQSDILLADATHTRADILTSCSVIIALIGIRLGYPVFDPLATCLIAVFIGYSAYTIFRDSSRVLCDTAVFMDVQKITDTVLATPGVKTCHKIRTRGRPDDVYVDLHVQVCKTMHIDRAHAICYNIEEAIKKTFPQVTDVVVHMEPQDPNE